MTILDFAQKLLNFLVMHPLTLLLTVIVWFVTTYFCEKYFGRVSLKTVGFCLIVAVAVTVGPIILLL
jgi:hypothetical protein